MNIMFCDFDEEWHKEVILRIAKKLGAKKIVSLSRVNHRIDNSGFQYVWLNNSLFNEHKYDCFISDNLPSIDSTIINQMLWCEKLYLPMLDRSSLRASHDISYQTRKKYYYTEMRILMSYLDDIDLCLFSNIPHVSFDYVLYGLCKMLDISCAIRYSPPVIPNRTATMYFMQDIFNHIPELKGQQYDDNDIILSNRMQAYIDYYGRNKEDIKQIIEFKDLDKDYEEPTIIDNIMEARKRVREGKLKATIKRKIGKRIRDKEVDRYIDSVVYKPCEEKYIYFPLHYQPECTSLPMGGYYYDQQLVVQMLSKYAPDDVKIYVKPHPNRSWLADKDFYMEIIKNKNVCLISPKENSYDLIDNALAIASLTGTSIIEALVREKPVLMFGYYIWQYSPGVFHCISNQDVEFAMNKICNEKNRVPICQVRQFLNELDKHLIDGAIAEAVQRTCGLDKNDCINNIVDGFVNYVKLENNL